MDDDVPQGGGPLIRRRDRAILLFGLVAGLSCGDSSTEPTRPPPPPPPPPTPQPTSVTVTPATAELTALGDTVRLGAEVRDQAGQVIAGATVSWSSGDTSVASVDATGLVTAASNGTAVVTARSGAAMGEARVSVRQSVDSVVVVPSAVELTAVGDTVRLSAAARDANGHVVAGAVFAWSSSDASVVAVDSAGLVTAVGAGTSEVAARSGSVTGTARVSVRPSVDSVVVAPSAVELTAVGDTVRLSAAARDANGHVVAGAVFAWSSSDASVVAVDSAGLVTAVGAGTSEVAARSGSVTGTARVSVRPSVDSVVVAPSAVELTAVGDTVRLSAAARDANGHVVAGAVFAWSSSDASVVAVDSAGLVTAVGAGTSEVAARSGSVTGTARVSVRPSVDSVVVAPSAVELTAVGDTVRLSAAARDANGHVVAGAVFAWSSSDASVVAVDSAGLVTAVGAGTSEVAARSGSVTGTARVSVRPSVAYVVVMPRTAALPIGDTLRLSAEARDANGHAVAGAVFAWSSSDPAVAVVDDDGLVRALTEGMATIVARSGTIIGTSEINVADADPERAALKALYRSTEGSGWTHRDGWLSDQPLGRWHGVETDASGRVVALRLRENNLIGPLPAQLGDLSHLGVLDLYGNFVSGPLPPEIGNATRLREIDLGRNQLAGSIPATLGSLVNLRVLNFESNRLSGPIPPELGALTELTFLNLFNNDLSGLFPPELADLRKLQQLYVDENRLTGVIPPSFVNLTDLISFQWGENDGLCAPVTTRFERWRRQRDAEGAGCDEADRAALERVFEAMNGGTWIRSTGWLSDAPLEEWHGVGTDSLGYVLRLDLSRNGLTGRVSPFIAELPHLTVLRLGGNPLEGPIPSALPSLALAEFRYGDTNLCVPALPRFVAWLEAIPVREGPDERCPPLTDRETLVALHETTDGANWFRNDNWGSDRPLGEWYGVETDDAGRIVELLLGSNNLRGRIPPEVGQLSSLRNLDLARNWLSGATPPELGDLRNIEKFHLNINLLTGPIPAELGGLASVRQFYLYDNQLEGPIPPELGGLSTLEDLRLNKNRLSGPIPPELGKLSDVVVIWMDDNELEGPIPPELADLHSVETLYLGFNNLTGEIPPELGSLRNIRNLALDGNELTGSIPPELGTLGTLGGYSMDGELNLRLNSLSGAIPAALGNLRDLETLRLGHNRLEGPVPSELGAMRKLEWLELAGNAGLTGPLPSSLSAFPALLRFEAGGTALCVAAGTDDPGWSGFVRLPPCEPMVETGSSAYLTQAVQSRAFPVPLIAGETALLRVFVTTQESTGAAIPPARATFFAGGEEIYSVDVPGSSGSMPTRVAEAVTSLDLSANVWIPGEVIRPGLEMVVEIDPSGTLDPGLGVARRIPGSGRRAVPVRAMPTFNLTVVPFLWRSGPDSGAVRTAAEMATDPEGHGLLEDLRNLMPVSDLSVQAHEPVWTTNNDSDSLLDEVGIVRQVEGGTGYWMAALSGEATGVWGVAWIPGRTSYVRFGRATVPEVASTLAHELGHNMRLWHAPCGVRSVVDPAYPHRNGAIGAWGLDSRSGRDVLVPPTVSDLMSYCAPNWISEYNFSGALRYRLVTEAAADRPAPPESTLLLWGGTEADGTPYLRPAFAVEAPPALPDSAGPQRIVGRGTDGEVLFSLSFAMRAVADQEGRAGFVFGVPFRPEWAGRLEAIELTGPTGSATLDRTTDRPSAILRDPSSGRVRAILLERVSALAAAAGEPGATPLPPNLDVIFSRGLPEPPRQRR
ncbi:Ig-like domain-containing protein [Candidatus Palauibacter sp.]|uniref:Ig-like domain-containing protein n=1 Tax=Candidatus Palauibacter sp. TaxID=3101350 RepID=UPI003C6F9A06